MWTAELTLNLVYNGLMAILYGAVAVAVFERRVSRDLERPRQGFMAWWVSLAMLSIGGMIATLIDVYGAWTLPAMLTYIQMLLLVIVVAMMGLMYYFVFLFTGSSGKAGWVVVLYVFYAGALLHFINAQEPIGLIMESGQTTLEFGRDLSETWFATAIGVGLLLPPVIGALAYGTLVRKVEDRVQKFRIVMVALSIFVWLGVALLASFTPSTGESTAYSWISKIIAITATAANLIAFKPPRWLVRRLAAHEPAEAPVSSG